MWWTFWEMLGYRGNVRVLGAAIPQAGKYFKALEYDLCSYADLDSYSFCYFRQITQLLSVRIFFSKMLGSNNTECFCERERWCPWSTSHLVLVHGKCWVNVSSCRLSSVLPISWACGSWTWPRSLLRGLPWGRVSEGLEYLPVDAWSRSGADPVSWPGSAFCFLYQ